MTVFHFVINNSCNLCCKYCGEEAFDRRIINKYKSFPEVDENIPEEMNFSIQTILAFLKSQENPTLVFYGGEPLLSHKKIEEIVSKIDFPCILAIQTNGTLLDRISTKTINKFSTILVSIDGKRETTDYFRGEGTYKKIISNIKLVIKNGFKGNIIARMALMEPIDFYREATYLLKNKDYSFKEIHWQMNANFYPDFEYRNFKDWSKNYFDGVKKLLDLWIKEIKKGKVIKLYPFLGIIKRIIDIENKKDFENYYLPCGAGHSGFAIQTDGTIIPCPIMIGMKEYYLGNIIKSKITEKELNKKRVNVTGCSSCSHYKICGGRCLYSNIIRPWQKEEYKYLCNLTKKTIDLLEEKYKKEIKPQINNEKIKKEDFNYSQYIGPEIIP